MNKTKRPRPPGELDKKFHNQMEMLVTDCKAYDAGHEFHAESMAGRLRILLHHNPSKRSHALLQQIGLLSELSFIDSGIRKDRLIVAYSKTEAAEGGFTARPSPAETGLVIPCSMNGEWKFMAPLVKNRYIPEAALHSCIQSPTDFNDWWETPFIENSNEKIFSRKNIVTIMANQDGGSHVDPDIDADFSDLCQDFHNIMAGSEPESIKPIQTNIASATIRQITYELMATIDEKLGTKWAEKAQSPRPGMRYLPTVTLLLN
ncbi:MAG: hypothetical protein ACT6R9_10375 [Methylophilus sp.]